MSKFQLGFAMQVVMQAHALVDCRDWERRLVAAAVWRAAAKPEP